MAIMPIKVYSNIIEPEWINHNPSSISWASGMLVSPASLGGEKLIDRAGCARSSKLIPIYVQTERSRWFEVAARCKVLGVGYTKHLAKTVEDLADKYCSTFNLNAYFRGKGKKHLDDPSFQVGATLLWGIGPIINANESTITASFYCYKYEENNSQIIANASETTDKEQSKLNKKILINSLTTQVKKNSDNLSNINSSNELKFEKLLNITSDNLIDIKEYKFCLSTTNDKSWFPLGAVDRLAPYLPSYNTSDYDCSKFYGGVAEEVSLSIYCEILVTNEWDIRNFETDLLCGNFKNLLNNEFIYEANEDSRSNKLRKQKFLEYCSSIMFEGENNEKFNPQNTDVDDFIIKRRAYIATIFGITVDECREKSEIIYVENSNDKIPPDIIIQEKIIINESSYEITGEVLDDSKVYVEIDGITAFYENGKFASKGYMPIGTEQLEIIATDQWGNSSKKIITIERISSTVKNKTYLSKLNPNKVKVNVNENRLALILGIEEYENISNANFAKRDAQYFIDYAQGVFGVPETNIKYFINANAPEKSKFKIKEWLKRNVNNDSEIYIYFSGHGIATNNGNDLYLLAYDTLIEYISETAFNRNEIFNDIAQYNPKRVTAFLDTCYSGAGRADGEMLLAMAKGLVVVDEQKQKLPDNFTLFTAASAQESAWSLPEAQHGTFSYFLMKGMEGNADLNGDKKLTNGELRDYLLDNVGRYAQQHKLHRWW